MTKERKWDKDFIEQNVWVNSRGQIVIDSRLKDIDDLIPFIEDNIYSQDGHGDAEGIEWVHVWKDYEQWELQERNKNG